MTDVDWSIWPYKILYIYIYINCKYFDIYIYILKIFRETKILLISQEKFTRVKNFFKSCFELRKKTILNLEERIKKLNITFIIYHIQIFWNEFNNSFYLFQIAISYRFSFLKSRYRGERVRISGKWLIERSFRGSTARNKTKLAFHQSTTVELLLRESAKPWNE